ncbi:hypothetical protein GLE_3186 [Lysobacter enzymogenes]|uniref:Uncharacterized protein n=1 Tax=Lysobacter enzymogenes TaxID=69 RepID=A0A0S2DJ33_LYSEN|nr:hypothetical protein GLE_3186 [Lysobacter enzymogenes]
MAWRHAGGQELGRLRAGARACAHGSAAMARGAGRRRVGERGGLTGRRGP